MASPGGGDQVAAAKNLRVLLPFSCDSLRIPDELAEDIGAGDALVVDPGGGKGKAVWRVEVGRDGDGAFLGRGWPELTDACGAVWLLVLRHRGRGVLTLKAFDDARCLRNLGAPAPPSAEAAMRNKDAARKPQFISVLPTHFMQKMIIPAKFVQQYIPKEHLNNHTAIVLGPNGKVYSIKLEMVQSDVFFTGGWSQFLVFHDITEADALLLRYEGNMVFTVKVFGSDGRQRNSKQKENSVQPTSTLHHSEKLQQALSSIKKHKRKNKVFGRKSIYKIGPPHWIKKQIMTKTLERHLALATPFCNAIGLQEHFTITLRTSTDCSRSWLVHGLSDKKSSYRLVQGWKQFCEENSLKEGDICTFHVIETTLWNVVITRHKETPKSKKERSSSDGQKTLQRSMTYKARTKCVFEVGPPAWLKKEINASTIQNHLNLSLPFCEGIGLRQRCTITLKTPGSSTRTWQARLNPYQNCCQLVGGWKSFCLENVIKH